LINLPINLQAYAKYREFRDNQLFLIRRKYNLRTEEFEDIFQDAIIVALKKFDKERGEFSSFFSTVFENRVRNYLRDIKLRIMLSSIETYENTLRNWKKRRSDDSEFLEYFRSIEALFKFS
jgi:DNA-directed RNA polymerase specialized sigma subunit